MSDLVEQLRGLKLFGYQLQLACKAADCIEALTKERDEAHADMYVMGEEKAVLTCQLAEMTKERDHWREANRNSLLAADVIIEIERQRVRDALVNSARLIEERNALAKERERCALCVEAYDMDAAGCARAIRRMT